MSSIKTGTKAAVLAAISFSIPSLVSTYRERLGITDLTVSKSKFNENISFRYQVPELKVLSPYHTVVTHMFHHKDFRHFLWNMYTLTSSTLYLDVGFEQTAFLFIGGGITGLLTHIFKWQSKLTLTTEAVDNINPTSVMDTLLPKELPQGLSKIIDEDSFKNVKNSYSQVRSQLTNKVFNICGSSAGVYAIVGAETVQIVCDLFKTIFGRGRRRSIEDKDDNEEQIGKLVMLEVNAFSRVNWLIAEILALLRSNESFKYDKILNIAHMNGFLFGAIVMTIWKLQDLFGFSL
ncbi:hypothetical protein H8356DRAFT_1271798 [Neocallimastix lanati (nom. inval.)]|jgi:hypothetical protein|uniref:Uncharacterized protein n=1 Tax=Neocallimastix californiae TaxID=1754190 RepID=A0A1Y2AEX2_9FUNG|nr:hypothetical protein H8356DRAFT_1271798 [Neocallimastix sp. JGI-2020a]ORY21143.1 hypothetical protein LY90DRAFT_516303 [Neocallimastix californiae]|eukprot:ORY21143.1 hypothetical protein LY90DRAFT_516303 [Neocallimastix californiae]